MAIGSPGARWTRTNVTVVTRKTTIAAWARRPATNRRTRLRRGCGPEADPVLRRALRRGDPPVGHPRPVLVGADAGRVDTLVDAVDGRVHVRGIVQPVLPECGAAPGLPDAGHVGIGSEADERRLEGTTLKLGG